MTMNIYRNTFNSVFSSNSCLSVYFSSFICIFHINICDRDTVFLSTMIFSYDYFYVSFCLVSGLV